MGAYRIVIGTGRVRFVALYIIQYNTSYVYVYIYTMYEKQYVYIYIYIHVFGIILDCTGAAHWWRLFMGVHK